MRVRSHRAFTSSVLVVSLLLAGSAFAQTPQSWNGWRFALPAGWQAEPTPEAMVLTAPGALQGSTVRLLAPQPVTGSFAQWFAQAVIAQARGVNGFRLGGPVKAAKTSEGVLTLLVSGQGSSATGQRVVLNFLGMQDARGQGLLMAARFDQVSALRNLRGYGELANTVEPVAAGTSVPGGGGATPEAAGGREMTGGVRQAPGSRGTISPGQRATPEPNADLASSSGPAPTQPSGHGIYDWFGSFYNSIMPGPNFTISSNMVWEFYRFFPNGYLYEGMPAGVDPAAINCTGPAQLKGGRCKHYNISGGTLMIDGEKPQSFAETASGIKVGGTDKNRVRPARGTLNGTWKTSSGGGVLTTVTLSQHLLTLRPDGTFSIQGGTGVSGANVAAYGSSAMAGRYKLNGYTIEMDYNNGRVVRQSFLLPYPDDKVFLIGDSMYFVPTK